MTPSPVCNTSPSPVARTLPWVLLTIALCWSSSADASIELARSHYRVGQAYYEQGRYAEAIKEFEQAYDLTKRAALLYNIAQAHERMGNLEQAVASYEKYLSESKKKEPAIVKKVENLRQRLRSTGIRVKSDVAGATVSVDGRDIGVTPLVDVIAVKPGEHQLKVTKSGFTGFSAYVSVNAGSVVNIEAKLTSTGVQSTAPVHDPPPTQNPSVDETARTEQPGRSRFWTWVALGSAGGLLATSLITGLAALNKADKAKTKDDTEANTAKSLALISDIALGLGLAAAAAGTILFFMEGQNQERSVATFAPAISPTFAGVNAALTF